MGMVALGWGRPLGGGGSAGWDWWALVGFAALMSLMLTARRTLPVVIGVSALGGLIVADLIDAWGVIPVWSGLLLIALSRNLLRSRRRPQV
jgi:hypothetical protein